VSGSGKSSLISETYPALSRALMGAQSTPGPYDRLDGLDQLDKVIDITQDPIGRTPRSNPATYVGIFDEIRQVFASTPESRQRGYGAGRFSFNVKGGRCEACQGHGLKKIEMHFLPDVWVTCQECRGARYNRHTLEITYKGKNIAETLDMDVQEALGFFSAFPNITRVLQTLHDGGLDYVKLASRPPPSPAARRSASSWPKSWGAWPPATRSTSSTSPPPGCISPISSACWTCSTAWRTPATRSSSSSTTST
jgi:excinuclease ABC subunit A